MLEQVAGLKNCHKTLPNESLAPSRNIPAANNYSRARFPVEEIILVAKMKPPSPRIGADIWLWEKKIKKK